MAKYAAAVDQGTTSTRFMVFDHSGKVVAVEQKEHEQIYPKPGWVEHNAMEVWQRTQDVIKGVLKKVNVKDIAAVGVTNQRETTVVWEKATGKPVHNAIVWQDTRTDTICNDLAKSGGQDRFRGRWDFLWRRTSRGRRSSGSWTTFRGCVQRRKRAKFFSATWTPG